MARGRTNMTSTQRRGFTLLEMLLAVTVLSTATLLIGAMWTQARSWSDDGYAAERLLRLQRASEAMRRQWNDRRTTVALNRKSGSVIAMPEELTFVTTTPLLFPDWPMVTASYRIERQPGSPLGDLARYDLVYTETKIAEVGAKPKDDDVVRVYDEDEQSTWTLLSGVQKLRWERFGQALPAATIGRESEVNERGVKRQQRDDGRKLDENGNPIEIEEDDDKRLTDDRINRWREFDLPDTRTIHAVRLLGEIEKEPFACVFVIEALR